MRGPPGPVAGQTRAVVHRLPEPIRGYLAHPCLEGVGGGVGAAGAQPPGGRRHARAGPRRDRCAVPGWSAGHPHPGRDGRGRVQFAKLDTALRYSSTACSLITTVADLTGGALSDRRAERQQRDTTSAGVWARLEAAGLAHLAWVPAWREQVRGQGLLTRADPEAGGEVVKAAVRVLADVAPALTLPQPQEPGPEGSGLAQLAARTTGDAHDLDEGRLAAALVLRAVAAALAAPWPADAAGRRLWEYVGVVSDQVSGTVLVFGVRPPGTTAWSVVLRSRTDLGLVTHLTLAGLLSPSAEAPVVAAEQVVHVCENPQVVGRRPTARARAAGVHLGDAIGGRLASAGAAARRRGPPAVPR
ncbi:TIGR02679 domain-containing protein [Kitasatospora sp. NPDC059795]|uniref:TIGR02679 domain-containing protein n=1 Tax=Kitasatospora sp. NPDC059795 TaxID=3346949 RepID=UPI0036481D32